MKTLIWKEWREHQLFFFLAIGIIVLIRIVPYFLPERIVGPGYGDYTGVLVFGLYTLSIFFSLFLGVFSFTGEFIKNTKSFLLSQPLTSKRLFWTKFFSGLVLLFALIIIAQFVFLILPFKGASVSMKRVNLGIFPLLMVLLYSAACFSSLLRKNSLPAIIYTPFVLIFGVLPILPLSIVLFLVSPNADIFTKLIFSALITVFVIFSFLTWQKAIVKDVSPVKTIFSTAVVILLISFAVHAIANLAATWKLNGVIQQAKAEGVKLTIQEIVPPLVRDKDNAALVYQQAFALAEKLEAAHKIKVDPIPRSWSAQRDAEWEKLRSEQAAAIAKDPEFARFYALIQKAVNFPSCRFDLNYEEGPAMRFSHLNKMSNLARLVAARTRILTREGRYEEALESAKTGFCLGDSLASEPVFISQLVRIAIDNIATESFKQLLNDYNGVVTIKNYQSLISEIDKKNKRLTKGLEGELPLDGLYAFRLGLGEIRNVTFHNMEFGNGKKVTDFADFMSYASSGSPPKIMRLSWKFYGSYLWWPILKGDYIFYIRSLSILTKLSQEPYFSVKSEISEWERRIARTNFAKIKYRISSMTLWAFDRVFVFVRQARYTANLESLKLSLALKIYKLEHGYYPDKLSSLSPEIIPELSFDPFTGKDYIYRKEGRGFILYSIGPNEKDDNGIYDSKQKYDDIAWKVLN